MLFQVVLKKRILAISHQLQLFSISVVVKASVVSLFGAV
jgi:hypothetical protein